MNTQTSRSVDLDRIEIVSDMCRLFDSGSSGNKHRIDGTLAMCRDIDNSIYEWANDVAIANFSAENPHQTQRSIQIRKDDRLIDSRIYKETKTRVRSEMMGMTKEVLHYVPTRIWKQNHKTFMVFVDNAIASVADRK